MKNKLLGHSKLSVSVKTKRQLLTARTIGTSRRKANDITEVLMAKELCGDLALLPPLGTIYGGVQGTACHLSR